MGKRKYSLLVAIVIGMLVSGCGLKKSDISNNETAPPNILFISVDDLRPELNFYGQNHIKSPSLDKLASESVVFERTYCNVPVCGASRASLMSGVRPGRYRFLGYSTYLDEDYPGITSLPRHFKNHGYTTISNGKIYHHDDDDVEAWDEIWGHPPSSSASGRGYVKPQNIRLDTMDGVRGYPYEDADVHDTVYRDGKTAEKAIRDLKKLKSNGQPFFLAVGYLKPHLPFNAPKKYWNMYDSTQISLPPNYIQPESTPDAAFHNFGELRHYSGVPPKGPVSNELANKLIHGYYACVSYTDAQIGKVLNALEELELENNTIVILWGDHGWNLGDHKLWCKHCNFESSLHVPMILKVPGQTNGERTDNVTEFVDIYPTLCELAGLPVPEHTDGESLVPLMKNEPRQKNFAVSKFHDGVTYIEGTLFYTEWLDENNEVRARMLFDHAIDPLELNNLAENPEYSEKVQELSKKLRANWGDDFFVDRRINN
jgi:iduronate 2-sulfatase